jgi:hypothetical protein
MAKVIKEIQVCADCLMVIANGDWSDIAPEDKSLITAGLKALGGWPHVGNEVNDLGFSWKSCQCCNRGLGGHRYHVVVLGE